MSEKKEFNKLYNKTLKELQIELVKLQNWVIAEGKKLLLSLKAEMRREKVVPLKESQKI